MTKTANNFQATNVSWKFHVHPRGAAGFSGRSNFAVTKMVGDEMWAMTTSANGPDVWRTKRVAKVVAEHTDPMQVAWVRLFDSVEEAMEARREQMRCDAAAKADAESFAAGR